MFSTKMHWQVAGLVIALGFSGPANAQAYNPHDVFALFQSPSGGSRIELADCGDGTPCGTVVWLDPTRLDEGETQHTVTGQNGEPVLGLMILQGFKRKRRSWRGGTVYAPGNDKTYAARIKRLDSGDLQLKGCIGPICQTQIWPFISNSQTIQESGNN